MSQYVLELLPFWDLDPLHVTIEAICLVIIVYLWFQKSYKIRERPEQLTEQEIDTLVDEWEPEPLVPRLSDQQKWNSEQGRVLTSAPSVEVELADGSHACNFASTNFLGMADHDSTKEAAIDALRTYGCGSCGPRGFYGTMDKHIECEARLASFMNTEEAIIYSSGFATVASSIPAFSKVFDLIICDAGVIHSIQTGVGLSRSKVVYFRHNDVADLKRILEQTRKDDVDKKKKPYRTFVVIEGLYQNYGDVAPLKEIVALKNEYYFRIIMDDSLGVGTLGKTGRGTCEYWGVPTSAIDVLTSSMSHALGSIGGFCAGARTVVFHQRLNASGYVFSASSPPYLVASATQALNLIGASEGKMQKELHDKIELFHQQTRDLEKVGLRLRGTCQDSPVIHFEIMKEILDAKLKELDEAEEKVNEGKARLEKRFSKKENVKAKQRLQEERLLQSIVDEALKQGVLFLRPSYVEMEKFMPAPSLRVTISTTHTEEHIHKAAAVLKECAKLVLG